MGRASKVALDRILVRQSQTRNLHSGGSFVPRWETRMKTAAHGPGYPWSQQTSSDRQPRLGVSARSSYQALRTFHRAAVSSTQLAQRRCCKGCNFECVGQLDGGTSL